MQESLGALCEQRRAENEQLKQASISPLMFNPFARAPGLKYPERKEMSKMLWWLT